jgi:hypothetical protein
MKKYNSKEINESLNKVLLMMKYDTSKTLDENKKIIKEQEIGTKTAIATGTAAGTAAAIAGGAAATGLSTSTALGAATYSAMGLGATLAPGLGVTAAAALGASVATGAAALALTPLIIWYMDKDNAKVKVERIIQYCVSDKSKIDKIERGLSDGEIRNLSDQLYDAMKGIGTDEAAVYGAFKSLKTASDFCSLVTRFNRDYGSEGDLLEWLDDDFDQTSEWMQIYRPLRDVVEDTLLSLKDEAPADDEKPEENKPEENKPSGGGYKPCSGTYSYGCKSPAIAKVQACLDLVTDGKFGPKTKAALKSKGFETFTDADIDKICGTQQPQPQPSPETDDEEVLTSYASDDLDNF